MNSTTVSEKKRRDTVSAIVLLCIAAFTVMLGILSLISGSVHIPAREVFGILSGASGSTDKTNIIMGIRLPRMLMAAFLGGALALSGYLLQTYFENPIAGPFVLGISSGARLAVAIALVAVSGRMIRISSLGLILAAFAGSLIVTGFIILAAGRVKSMAGLLVAGIMVGYICQALTEFVVNFADDNEVVNLHSWSLGSFSGLRMDQFYPAAACVVISLILVMMLSKPIGAFQLGESYAASMGVNVKRFRVILILLSSILSAVVTAYAGPISFVGIAVPFLIRRSMKSTAPLFLVPAVFIGGAAFCLLSDLIARTVLSPAELPVSTVTSLFGAPIVIFMLIRRKRN